MSSKVDWDKAARRSRLAPETRGRAGEPTIPEMAYDARLEIRRLAMLLETRERMQKREGS